MQAMDPTVNKRKKILCLLKLAHPHQLKLKLKLLELSQILVKHCHLPNSHHQNTPLPMQFQMRIYQQVSIGEM